MQDSILKTNLRYVTSIRISVVLRHYISTPLSTRSENFLGLPGDRPQTIECNFFKRTWTDLCLCVHGTFLLLVARGREPYQYKVTIKYHFMLLMPRRSSLSWKKGERSAIRRSCKPQHNCFLSLFLYYYMLKINQNVVNKRLWHWITFW